MSWSLRRILFVCFCVIVLASGGLSAYFGARLIRQRVSEEAQARVQHNLGTGKVLYDAEVQRILSSVRLSSKLVQTAAAIREGATAAAQAELGKIRTEAGLDFLSLVNAEGQVSLRTTAPFSAGDSKAADSMIAKALEGKEVKGSRVLTKEELTLESPHLALQAATAIKATPRAKPRDQAVETSGLVLVAAAPVRDKRQEVIGALYAGKLLNRNYAFVDALRDAAFGSEVFDGKQVGTVTVFQWDLRVATNVANEEGDRAIGTLVSATVHDRVLESGKPWLDSAFVVNDWYLTAYEPIRDIDEKIVGIFYMGILERKYDAIRDEAVGDLMAITLVGMLLATGVAYVLASRLTTPLGKLAELSHQLGVGGPGYTVDVAPTCREVKDLADAFNQMSGELQAREQELVQTNDALRVANKNYMEMLGFVTHELKSPLSSCTLNVGILRNEIAGSLNEKQKGVVTAIHRNIGYFEEMIKNYLDLSRIEKGELALDRKSISVLDDVVQPMLDAVKSQLDERNMEVEVNIAGDLTIDADPNLLRIVFDNLLSNAAKYGDEGGKVRLGCERLDSMVRLNVWTQGKGIPPDAMPKLFQKFSRLTEKGAREKGTGLGLFISREIVEKHGGRIWAESEPGQFADFILEIPTSAS